MRVDLVYNSLISNVWVCLDSSLVHRRTLFKVWGVWLQRECRICPLQCFSFRGHPLTRGSAPWPRWGLRSQTPIIGSRSRARHILSVPVPSLLETNTDYETVKCPHGTSWLFDALTDTHLDTYGPIFQKLGKSAKIQRFPIHVVAICLAYWIQPTAGWVMFRVSW